LVEHVLGKDEVTSSILVVGSKPEGERRDDAMNRTIITLECPVCKERNYTTTKNKRTMPDKLVLPKFCPRCRKHTEHKETK
jgi:large subunit ribosomal protein L33